MANISEELNAIKRSSYIEDVRIAIAYALETINDASNEHEKELRSLKETIQALNKELNDLELHSNASEIENLKTIIDSVSSELRLKANVGDFNEFSAALKSDLNDISSKVDLKADAGDLNGLSSGITKDLNDLKDQMNAKSAILEEAPIRALRDTPSLIELPDSDHPATQSELIQLRADMNEGLNDKASQYDFDYIVGNGFQGWTITDYIIRIREDLHQALGTMMTREQATEIARQGVNDSAKIITINAPYPLAAKHIVMESSDTVELAEMSDIEDAKAEIDSYFSFDVKVGWEVGGLNEHGFNTEDPLKFRSIGHMYSRNMKIVLNSAYALQIVKYDKNRMMTTAGSWINGGPNTITYTHGGTTRYIRIILKKIDGTEVSDDTDVNTLISITVDGHDAVKEEFNSINTDFIDTKKIVDNYKEDFVIVSETEPESDINEIWVNPTAPSIELLTTEDFNNSVRFDAEQDKTNEEKTLARMNIDALGNADVFDTETVYPYKIITDFFTSGSYTDRSIYAPANNAISIQTQAGYNSYYVVMQSNIDLFLNPSEFNAYLAIAKVGAPITTQEVTGRISFIGTNPVRYRTIENNLPTENSRLHFSVGDVAAITIGNTLSPNDIKIYYGTSSAQIDKTKFNENIELADTQIEQVLKNSSNFIYRGRIVNDLHYVSIAQCTKEGTYYFTTEEAASITDLPANWITGGLVIKTYNTTFLTAPYSGTYAKFGSATSWSYMISTGAVGKTDLIKTSAPFIKFMQNISGFYCNTGSNSINFYTDNALTFDTYYAVFPEGISIYFNDDLPSNVYLSLCIGEEPIGELEPVTGQNYLYRITCSNPIRLRKTGNEDTLPYGVENAIDVGNKLVCITYQRNAYDAYFNIRGVNLSERLPVVLNGLGNSLSYPISQRGITRLLREPLRLNLIKYVEEGGNQHVHVFIPTTDECYIKYDFVHAVIANRNADIWKINNAYVCNKNGDEIIRLTEGGEWECALRLTNREDFSGGSIHGNEVCTKIEFIMNGRSISDISAYINRTSFDELTILQSSTLYDNADGTTIIARHYSEHIFSHKAKSQVTIKQTIKWENNFDIANCYLAMFPISKNVSDTWYNDYTFERKIIEYGNYYNITEINMIGNANKVKSRFGITKYIKNDNYLNNGRFLLTDNGGNPYNKCYYTIAAGSSVTSKAGEVTSDTIWQTESYYNFEYV